MESKNFNRFLMGKVTRKNYFTYFTTGLICTRFSLQIDPNRLEKRSRSHQEDSNSPDP